MNVETVRGIGTFQRGHKKGLPLGAGQRSRRGLRKPWPTPAGSSVFSIKGVKPKGGEYHTRALQSREVAACCANGQDVQKGVHGTSETLASAVALPVSWP